MFVLLTGLDYVSHEDILPYIPSELKPINHELFDRFFLLSYGKGMIFVHMGLMVMQVLQWAILSQNEYQPLCGSMLKSI